VQRKVRSQRSRWPHPNQCDEPRPVTSGKRRSLNWMFRASQRSQSGKQVVFQHGAAGRTCKDTESDSMALRAVLDRASCEAPKSFASVSSVSPPWCSVLKTCLPWIRGQDPSSAHPDRATQRYGHLAQHRAGSGPGESASPSAAYRHLDGNSSRDAVIWRLRAFSR
jgi:hypothetical protein